MKETIDVLELLESQHTEVEDLIEVIEERLENGKGDCAALFAELADKIAAHATVEEKIFYPAAMYPETSDMLHESVEEHLAVKRLLADMLDLDPDAGSDAETFCAKLGVLEDLISHHAHEEEEDQLFPILRRVMTEDERAALGNEVLAMFESLLEQQPRRNVPRETRVAAPLPAP
jgi:hemerythrin-like domain-containing protein